ncbi:hypothetical protein [Flavobacterium branchiophilum]|uniref:Lipocalin-like domain-containing protein n=1 Tax=Flavobacterium branchiophilum TaxID=55197 RepID=A0A2H3KUX2_9FLAO|nr:hypothetical protein [Flavobacterium branchiophilum]PDS24183.1 hypothetical protein B0A77_08595 [Flavobacterium branchiophilum]
MKIIIFIFFGLILYSCKNKSSEDLLFETEKRESLNINEDALNGKWYLNKWTYYHTLDINGDSIYVDNHIDSVFYLKYRLSKDTLITWSQNSKKLNKNRILKVSNDTLVFESFLNSKDEINYSRTEREMEN